MTSFKKATLLALEARYGLLDDSEREKERFRHAVYKAGSGISNRESLKFGNQQRRVVFQSLGDSFILDYEDHDLVTSVRDEQKAKKEITAKRSAAGL